MNRQVPDRDRISISLKTSSVTTFHRSSNTIWSFDRAGRPLGHFYQGHTFRRTLDNRWFEKSRKMYQGETFRTVIPIDSAPILSRLAALQSNLDHRDTYDTAEVQNTINRIGRLTPESLEADGQSFRNLYSPIGILPPDQYRALVIQISEGCHYNRCTFCSLYQDIPFRIKTMDEIEAHALAIKSFFGKGLSYRNSIFLGDANALITPMNVLVPAIKQIRGVFPEITTFTAFMDVFTGYKKNSRDFTALFKLGLKRPETIVFGN
ncbi:MAG: hypothetical protein GXO90_01750 [FCB group bacterium]|nr:hypothetical protein [FCB group bacterium]